MAEAPLFDEHRQELLVGSAIAPAVVAERGYRTIGRPSANDDRPRQELRRLGFPSRAIREDRYFPGLLLPMYRATGELIGAQWKPRVPFPGSNGKPQKYASPAGRTNRLDVHPRNRDRIVDPTVPLWVTEGIKKADSLTSQGLCVVALTGVWNWRSQLGTLGDWEDVPLKGRTVTVVYDADARDKHQVLSAMVRLGRWLKSKGAKEVRYVITPEEVNGAAVKGADDFLAAAGTVAQLEATATTRPPQTNAGDYFTDARMAETVAAYVLDGRFLWCKALGWLEWDGRRWRECSDETVAEQVRQWVLDRFALAAKQGDPELVKNWFKVCSRARQQAVVALARGIVEVRAAKLDAHPDLLNVGNGVVDLSTGTLREHDPALLLTKCTAVAYHAGAAHPDWTRALEAVPAEVREWYRLRCGQAVTGHMTPDDLLVVQQGGGENGKTTITLGIAAALGDYYRLVSHRALLASPDAHPTELMDFRGARFALLEETPEERRLSVVRLKTLVGTPQITARLIRKDSVTFDASHSLFLSTNYKPLVQETDHGTWRRLALLRFPYTFRKPGEPLAGPDDRAGDPTLRERVKLGESGQHEAVLAWLVAGAVTWYQAGKVFPALPERIAADTRTWHTESDLIMQYLDERLVFDPGWHVMTAELLTDFNNWLATKGARPWGDRVFSSRFGEHGEVTGRGVVKGTGRESGPGRLSRRPLGPYEVIQPPAPESYKAWHGMRFQVDPGPSITSAASCADGPQKLGTIDSAAEQGKYGSRTAGTDSSDNALEKRLAWLTERSVPAVRDLGQISTPAAVPPVSPTVTRSWDALTPAEQTADLLAPIPAPAPPEQRR